MYSRRRIEKEKNNFKDHLTHFFGILLDVEAILRLY
jgi:hypothetical protein